MYEFYQYNYGPYSDDIAADLAALSHASPLVVEEQPRSSGADGGKTVIQLGEGEECLMKR